MPTAMPPPTLLAVPNVSEGREEATIAAIGAAFAGGSEIGGEAGHGPVGGRAREHHAGGVRLLDTHSDADHHRTVFTLTGPPGALGDALLRGARAAVEEIDIGDGRGAHPHVGAIDVVPVVYLDDGARGAACAEALVVADRIGEELHVPVFLYGALAGGRALLEALNLLRQTPPGKLRGEPPHTVLSWALEHWNPATLERVQKATAPATTP